MEKTENILKLIADSGYSGHDKNQMASFVKTASTNEKQHINDLNIIDYTCDDIYDGCLKIKKIVLSTDDVKIYKIVAKENGFDDDSNHFHNSNPFRLIYKKSEGNWVGCGTVASSLDEALLVYLQYKHLGENSQFSEFASRMLYLK